MRVIGIDAGGTKTVGLLADGDGRVLAEARDTGANLHTHGELGVEKVIDSLLERLTAGGPVDALCLGIAGVDRPEDEAVVRGILKRLGHRDRTRVVNDAIIALVAGAPERHGIVVLAGTGSIAYGEDRDGRSARSGGLGAILADEGSAFWLGSRALIAAVRAADGRGPATALAPLVLGDLSIASVSELVALVYPAPGLPRRRVAALAPLVERAAQAGDAVADGLLDAAAHELAVSGRAVVERLSLAPPFPVVLAGGTFKACPSLVARVSRALDLPGAEIRLLEVEPAMGAVTLALDVARLAR
jgi:N-acetylglucosamine kinase-like BadF-type ATPase